MKRVSIVRATQVTGIVLVSLAICGWLAWEFVLYPNLYTLFGNRQIFERDIAMWTSPINVPREGLEGLSFSYRKLHKTRGLRWQPIAWQVAKSELGGAGLFYDPADGGIYGSTLMWVTDDSDPSRKSGKWHETYYKIGTVATHARKQEFVFPQGTTFRFEPADVLGIARSDTIVVALPDVPPQVDAKRFERDQHP